MEFLPQLSLAFILERLNYDALASSLSSVQDTIRCVTQGITPILTNILPSTAVGVP